MPLNVAALHRTDRGPARAALFRAALLEAGTTPAALARDLKVQDSTVSLVLQGHQRGGPKGCLVQDKVAELLAVPVARLFPDRGPASTGRAAHRAKT